MAITAVFLIIILFTAIRTISYGIFCIKNNSKCGAVSVFLLCAFAVATGFIAILCEYMR